MRAQIAGPFVFNAGKHHAGFLKSVIAESRKKVMSKEQILEFLLKIGNSMIDIYYGTLSIEEIVEDIKKHLVAEGHFAEGRYLQFIHRMPGKYANVAIRDASVWTLLLGNDPDHYIHLHPARQSPHTLRVRALALKTALLLKIYYAEMLESGDLVILVNEVRSNFLDESPIKNISYTKSLVRVLGLF